MTRRLLTVLALGASVLAAGCAGIAAPLTEARPVTAGSMSRALNAAVTASMSTDWVPKTISPETGYVMAERADPLVDPYRLVLLVPAGGNGSMSLRITPLSSRRLSSDDDASALMKAFLDAFDKAMGTVR